AGCAKNLAMRCWRTWQGNNHYLRPPPGLARFCAATRLATKRQQTLTVRHAVLYGGETSLTVCCLFAASSAKLPRNLAFLAAVQVCAGSSDRL
ncbi:MAG: hypothetical protein KJ884_06940, partial [Gammaproteobacteria bacterium]|nr:hypothetical protein [Gammaproteobacteria bacterium]